MQDEICQALPEDNVALGPRMIHHLLEGLRNNHEIERAIFLFRDIRARGIDCRHRTYNFMISMCVEIHEPEEAFRRLIDFHELFGDKEGSEHLWWMVLECCARNGHVRSKPQVLY